MQSNIFLTICDVDRGDDKSLGYISDSNKKIKISLRKSLFT